MHLNLLCRSKTLKLFKLSKSAINYTILPGFLISHCEWTLLSILQAFKLGICRWLLYLVGVGNMVNARKF